MHPRKVHVSLFTVLDHHVNCCLWEKHKDESSLTVTLPECVRRLREAIREVFEDCEPSCQSVGELLLGLPGAEDLTSTNQPVADSQLLELYLEKIGGVAPEFQLDEADKDMLRMMVRIGVPRHFSWDKDVVIMKDDKDTPVQAWVRIVDDLFAFIMKKIEPRLQVLVWRPLPDTRCTVDCVIHNQQIDGLDWNRTFMRWLRQVEQQGYGKYVSARVRRVEALKSGDDE